MKANQPVIAPAQQASAPASVPAAAATPASAPAASNAAIVPAVKQVAADVDRVIPGAGKAITDLAGQFGIPTR